MIYVRIILYYLKMNVFRFLSKSKSPVKSIALIVLSLSLSITNMESKVINVPSDFAELSDAVAAAEDGDVIMIHPGIYKAKNILIDKRITITSEWYSTGDPEIIDQTIINAEQATLFFIRSNDVEISGLRFEDGDDTFDIEARVIIKYCHFARHNDPVSMEGNGGGYVGYCRFTENTASEFDDAIDCDIGENGPRKLTVWYPAYLLTTEWNQDSRFILPTPIQFSLKPRYRLR